MKIACDMDDVLATFVSQYIKVWNKEHKTSYNIKDSKVYNLGTLFNVDSSEVTSDILIKQMDGFMKKLKPYKDVQKYMSKLKKEGHIVNIITSRCVASDSYEWLKDNNIPFNKLFLVGNKLSLFKYHDLIIDDNPVNIKLASNIKKKSILYEQPWNVNIQENKYIRKAKNWKDIYKIIKEENQK